MKYFFCCIFLIAGIFAFAQTQETTDPFIQDSLAIVKVKLVKPQFKFDNRVAFFERQALATNGFDVGVLLSEKLRFTLGYYSMNGHLRSYDYTSDGSEFGRFIKMDYGSLNTELIYKDSRFLSFGMPLEIGGGVNTLQNKNITTNTVISSKTGGLLFVNF